MPITTGTRKIYTCIEDIFYSCIVHVVLHITHFDMIAYGTFWKDGNRHFLSNCSYFQIFCGGNAWKSRNLTCEFTLQYHRIRNSYSMSSNRKVLVKTLENIFVLVLDIRLRWSWQEWKSWLDCEISVLKE